MSKCFDSFDGVAQLLLVTPTPAIIDRSSYSSLVNVNRLRRSRCAMRAHCQ
eukprot:m.1063556 g.1063556  ORF g.1063556 m.1063556 type:complete len:51 (-) comp24216_c0_seq16:6-158(-)